MLIARKGWKLSFFFDPGKHHVGKEINKKVAKWSFSSCTIHSTDIDRNYVHKSHIIRIMTHRLQFTLLIKPTPTTY